MRIRLGYVAIALNLDKVTSSSTLTYSRYLKMDEENRLKKLKEVTYSNIEALEKILAFSTRIRYPVYRACDWRKRWETTGEHAEFRLPAAWAPCFCGTQAAFFRS